MMDSFRHNNSDYSSSTDDTKFFISDLLVPLKKEEKTKELEPSISSFCNWCFLQCCKK